ncbi:MAG: 3-keto-5-aminohexanoate cleavage protein [Deltaproteobacteria bacterium]|nr:3-keto-5-aminohexanoate cleavage protein [Deltaproteobacteria bacterium]
MASKPIIVSCALTGAATDRRQCPVLPYTPAEIADEAKRAYDAGATIVHIHAREDDGKPSWRLPIFQAIKEEVRKRCPVLLNFSTGGIGNTIVERTEQVEHATPEIAALNMGSMNYAIYSSTKKKFLMEAIFENPFKDIITALTRMQKAGVMPEMECFDAGHISNADPLIDMGLLKAPFHFSLVMGVTGGIAATPKHLKFMSEILPPGSTWQVIGISREQWMLCDEALKLGGNIRVGLEDNFYLPDGKTMAKGNGELVEHAVKLVERHGHRAATLEETRRLMGVH